MILGKKNLLCVCVMKSFWKFNLFVSVTIFLLFNLYLISIKFCFVNYGINNFIASKTLLFFMYGIFLEIIQIPICCIGLFFDNVPKNIWLFFLMMVTFAIIKILLYVYILGSGL